jgi:hypothetical protein
MASPLGSKSGSDDLGVGDALLALELEALNQALRVIADVLLDAGHGQLAVEGEAVCVKIGTPWSRRLIPRRHATKESQAVHHHAQLRERDAVDRGCR